MASNFLSNPIVITGVMSVGVPSAPTVTPVGTAGTTVYDYEVSAMLLGAYSAPSAAGSTSTGNANLGSGNSNTVAFSAVTGATAYLIYRTVGGATQGLIGTTTSLSFSDTGLPATSPTPSAASSFGYKQIVSSALGSPSSLHILRAYWYEPAAATDICAITDPVSGIDLLRLEGGNGTSTAQSQTMDFSAHPLAWSDFIVSTLGSGTLYLYLA